MAKQTIMIAGGSRGIGKFLLDSLLPNYNVSVCARSIMELEGDTVLTVPCDLTTLSDVGYFVAATLRKFGHIDAMIYNAGEMLFDSVLDTTEKDMSRMYAVMVQGYLTLCKAVIPGMRERKSGHIINISSTRGVTAAPNKCGYSAMKRAATSITDSIRVENRAYGIQATSIHCGLVNTESSRALYGEVMGELHPIEHEDIYKVIRMLLSLSPNATVGSIVVGGML